MKLSSETWIVIAAVLLAALLAGQQRRDEWKLTRGGAPDTVHFRIEHSSKGSKWSQSNDVPLANFHGMNTSQSGTAKFEYIEDAGTLLCQGRFSFGAGSGTYAFQPSPKFARGLTDLGYDLPSEGQSFSLLLNHVTLDFARGVRDAGVRATTSQLIELRTHGITLPYIRETQNAGYTTFSAADFIEMKIHGVSTDFLRALKHAGYELPARQITELQIHGVNADYMRDLNIYGLRPRATDIVQMKIHGITPDYLKSLKDAGYGDLSSNQIAELKNNGLDAKFILEAKDLGYDFTSRELVELKVHGVSAEYLRHLRESGMRNLSAQQITKLKIHGVE
ncbi:MAG: hypothetical protein JWP63_1107 [Candidatus Solibacter sp.]|nr:hypothetical protein [Candidatus Solibacter sp.]